MTVLIGAVVIVGAVCLIDLLLTLGTIRRLREHTAMLARIQSGQYPVIGVTALTDGTSPQSFTATDADGLDVIGPAGLSVVAFFSTSCPICPERVPAFTDYLGAHPGARDEVLAVVTGEADGSVSYLADLAEVAHVCTEADDGPIGRAFAVLGFPAFFVLDADGTVLASSFDPAELPTPAAV